MAEITTEIHKVWAAEQEILDVVDGVCRKHHLKYSLAYGTLLGAVRHGGFIPWDDDIDIIMPRDDYETLLSIWNEAPPSNYILQNTRTDPDFTQNFTKIRKDHTAFIQDECECNKKYHKGIFIDIFPCDRVAPGNLTRKMQYIACAVNLLFSRRFPSGTGGLIGVLERIILRIPSKFHPICRNRSELYIRKWNGNQNALLFAPSTIDSARKYYSNTLFDEIDTISFGDKMYSCVHDWDAFLQVDYNNYMELPPEEDRIWKHHPIVIDFEHNYEELSGALK